MRWNIVIFLCLVALGTILVACNVQIEKTGQATGPPPAGVPDCDEIPGHRSCSEETPVYYGEVNLDAGTCFTLVCC